ncbi:helix-turn-helix transcriptional regulator [uncultured Paracoccus sp.]|uniref:helix-turn-helix domain-containing protein n=1 Tax=uncultured Paracoccus sp. TaxID=189685 RepID=UPI002601458F|nr:helix-turn-helix transcriptional regulator [uncultured Paracoccus sp.]
MDITDHITASGRTRSEICQEVGISLAMLSLIESGKRRIGIAKAAALSAALGVQIRDVRPDLSEMFGESIPQPAASAAPTQEHSHENTSDGC